MSLCDQPSPWDITDTAKNKHLSPKKTTTKKKQKKKTKKKTKKKKTANNDIKYTQKSEQLSINKASTLQFIAISTREIASCFENYQNYLSARQCLTEWLH